MNEKIECVRIDWVQNQQHQMEIAKLALSPSVVDVLDKRDIRLVDVRHRLVRVNCSLETSMEIEWTLSEFKETRSWLVILP